MWADKVISELSEQKTYTRQELLRRFQETRPDLNDSTFRWILYGLQKDQTIFRVGRDEYSLQPREAILYRPLYTDAAQNVIRFLENRFPDLVFVVFESVLLNEFLNHQIAQNTIYIQAEKDLGTFVFDVLRDEGYGNVLYRPDSRELDRYWSNGCIVVQNLISQAPLSAETPHEITAEKMLVDILAEKSIAMTFSPAELPAVFRNIARAYQVDWNRVLRYAGRRGKAEAVRQFMEER